MSERDIIEIQRRIDELRDEVERRRPHRFGDENSHFVPPTPNAILEPLS